MRRAALAALTLAGAAGILPAAAQDLEELGQDRALTARISQSFVADSNIDLDDPSPGTSYFGDTRFGLDFLNATPTQSFALGFDTGLRSLWQAEEDFEFVLASPSTGYVNFLQEGPDTRFDAEANVRTRQVNSTSVIDGEDIEQPGEDLLDQGNRETREQRYDANIGLALGTSSPSTYEFRLLATAFDYTDAENTDLVPRNTIEGQALWTLRITPVFSTALFGSYFYYDADDDEQTELNIAEAEAGLVYEPSEVLRIRGGLGWADRHREGTNLSTGERETIEDEQGLTARGDILYLLPSFTLAGNARVSAAAPETRLSGGLTATYNLPRGRVRGRVFQNYTGGRAGDEERVTGASIGLERDLNTVSRIGLDFAYATQVNQDNPEEPDIDRTDVTATYAYDFTEAITAEVGYGFRNRIEDPEDADSHRVFFVIGRTFQTGL